MSIYFFQRKPVLHLGIRGCFSSGNEFISLRISGRTSFMFYIDGKFTGDGPSRFPGTNPQYTTYNLRLTEGEHNFTVFMQYIDMETRICDNITDPFFYLELIDQSGNIIPLDLYYKELNGYDVDLSHRMATTFGILEWCYDSTDINNLLANDNEFLSWNKLTPENNPAFNITEDPTRPVLHLYNQISSIKNGILTEEFGYERDCVAARFFLRQLDDCKAPAQGYYYRYDLGAVKLARPCFTLDLPKGTIVEIASCEQLVHDRVNPFLTLTGDLGSNMVHFIASGGVQRFMPLTPLGGRYIELHIVCQDISQLSSVKILEESYYWRTFFDKEPGAFHSNDEKLNRIWQMSVDTLRSCTEDVVTDCPSRERGQWTGDCSVVGLRTTSIAYGDMQVIRKSLLQATLMPDENGIIPCLFPGQRGYFITYSLLWVSGLMDYYMATGDLSLLEATYPAALRFMNFMQQCFEPSSGRLLLNDREVDCGFIDWGYEVISGRMIIPVIGMYYLALQSFVKIQAQLKQNLDASNEQLKIVSSALLNVYDISDSIDDIGYHGAVLLLKTRLFSNEINEKFVEYIKSFVLTCFPNNKDGKRLYSPTIFLKDIITPYFYNFTLWSLMENNEVDFVQSQIKVCWGYMLENGDTTCLEVFDHRWSHCHQWSGCPGWILSCYGLGLFKRYDLGMNHFELDFRPGELSEANGSMPLSDGSVVRINWKKSNDKISYKLNPDKEIYLHYNNKLIVCRENMDTEIEL